MLKQQWSSTGPCSTGGLFYFVLNISIPPVLLGNGHLQTPAGSMERAREGSNSSCVSQRLNETARGPCFFSRGFCRAGIWQQRWAGSTCTPGRRDLVAGGGWMLVQTLLWALNTDGRGREAKVFFCQNLVFCVTLWRPNCSMNSFCALRLERAQTEWNGNYLFQEREGRRKWD